jgi:hypothetical protein
MNFLLTARYFFIASLLLFAFGLMWMSFRNQQK